MGVICGNDIAVDGEVSVRGFRLKYTGKSPPFTASGYKHGSGRTRPITDWKVQYYGYGHTPAKFPGDAVSLVLSVDGSLGFAGTGVVLANIVRSSIEKGGPVEYIVEVGANGALTPGAAVEVDTSVPTIFDGTDTKVATSIDNIAWTDEDDVRDITLELRLLNDGKPYSSSALPRVTKRTKGSLDASLTWNLYNGVPADLLDPADDHTDRQVRYYVTPLLFWEINNVRIMAIDPFGGGHEDPENVNGTMLAEWNAITDGTALGSIINPAAVTKWPAA